ncbi:hypothetical protein [Streptomyces sp. HPF1205]|uniref:hypothetical protein n=1 Tax=Streptomyces sp. HPF1205 TaxID=2873262 RepID=UPI001CED15DE|nr:hypothetical protein [Streptomyces sp. HPF1205]
MVITFVFADGGSPGLVAACGAEGREAAGASVACGTPRQTAAPSRLPHGRTHGMLTKPPLVSRFAGHQTAE